MKLSSLLLFGIFILTTFGAFASVFTVTNTNGNVWWPACGDPGSLQEAVCAAAGNPGRDTVVFDLPGGTTISSAKDPFTLGAAENDLLINGFSIQDGNPVIFDFSVTVTGTDITMNGVAFQTINHSLIITGSNNEVDSCAFTVTGGGQNALWINGGTGTVVTNSVFNSSLLHAISIENGGAHTVDRCTVLNSGDVGIIVRGSGDNVIKNCSVSEGNHNGIGLISGDNRVDSNIVFDNARAGIVGDNTSGGCSNNSVSYNEVYSNNNVFWMNAGNPTPDQGGIQFDGASTTIYNNWVYNNAGNGILLNKSAAVNGVVRKNIVGRYKLGNELVNGWNGIFIWEANNAIVDSNVVVNNGKGNSHASYSMPDRVSGIRFQEVSSGTIKDNFIGTDVAKINAGNDFDGITIYTNVSGVDIHDNVICNNGFNSAYGDGGGLAFRDGSGNNNVYSNYIGFHPDLSDGGNFDYGIALEGANDITIGGNTSSEGNVIGNSKNPPLIGSARGTGIWLVLSGTTNNFILNNTIVDNLGAGIEIERNASSNVIGAQNEGNEITGNRCAKLRAKTYC